MKARIGRPATEILRYADETKAGLIIMASRGSSGEGPWLLGSVAAKVLRATRRPVLLIRVSANEEALQQRRLVKRILVPLDGSEIGEATIPFIEVLAQTLGAQVILLHVLEPVITWGMYEGYPAYRPPKDAKNRERFAATYLDNIAKSLKKKGLSTSNVVVWGLPARRIIDYAKANNIDLIAMSAHGRSGIAEWVFGSVTDKVLHTGNTPVLVVRPPKA